MQPMMRNWWRCRVVQAEIRGRDGLVETLYCFKTEKKGNEYDESDNSEVWCLLK